MVAGGSGDELDKGAILHEKRMTRAQLSAHVRAGGAAGGGGGGGGGAAKKPRNIGPDGEEEEQELSD